MLEGSVCFLPYIDVIRYAFCPVHHERAKRLKQGAKKQEIRHHKFILPKKVSKEDCLYNMVPLSPLQMEVNTHFPHAQKPRVSHLDSVGNMNDFVTEEGLVVQILNTRSCFSSLAGFSVAHGSTCDYCLSYKVIQQIKNHQQCRSIIFKKAFGTTGV